jgi:hypothetical protein
VPTKFLCRLGQLVPEPPGGQQLLPVLPAWQQVPPQVSVVHVAWQVPAEQLWPSRQEVAQAPQWAGSVLRSTQAPLHSVSPAVQACWHVPPLQVWPAAQAVPQAPQFLGSVEVLVQTAAVPEPQTCFGDAHTQAEAVQTSPAMQTFPHAPQLEALVDVSRQVPVAGSLGQSATGGALHTQEAAWQVPSPQSWPQVPQFAVAVCLFTHWMPQVSGWAAGHAQSPALQLAPAMQLVLQVPQWSASVWRSTQTPLQAVCPAGQLVVDDEQPAPTAATSRTATHVQRATCSTKERVIGHLPR